MKETPIFEEVFASLIRQPSVGLKLLIGGLLAFAPLLNILAFGYLYRFARVIRRSGQLSLPEWRDWQGLFNDGLRLGAVWLVYWALPLLLAALLGLLLSAINLDVLGYLLFTSTLLCANVVFCAALYRFQTRQNYADLLDLELIFTMSLRGAAGFTVPSILFLGIVALGLPLYGLTFFAGFTLMIAYSSLYYRSLEQRAMAHYN